MAVYWHGVLEIDLHTTLIYLSPSLNKWHHLAFSGGGGNECVCFLDGVKSSLGYPELVTTSSNFMIGNGYFGYANNLKLAYFRVSNNIRWTQNFTVPELNYYYNKHKLYMNNDNGYGNL